MVPIETALRLAADADLDLVEVAPNSKPPVAKIMDFGKFKYEAAQKQKEARRNQANTILKEVRFRLKIDKHDYETKRKRAEGFLLQGDKVKAEHDAQRAASKPPRAEREETPIEFNPTASPAPAAAKTEPETPKAETAKVETPRTEAAETEASKAETPKAEAPRSEAPKAEAAAAPKAPATARPAATPAPTPAAATPTPKPAAAPKPGAPKPAAKATPATAAKPKAAPAADKK